MSKGNNFAFVTLLDNEEYIYSVIACYSSWLKTESIYPFYCACTRNVPAHIIKNLEEMNINIIMLEHVTGLDNLMNKLKTSGFSSWASALQKLAIYGLEQFDKIVLLDADTYIYKNIDHLFNYPHITGVADGLGRKTNEYKFVRGDNYFKKFNAGMLIVEPSKELFNRIINFTRNLKLDRPWADQMILSELYPNWMYENDKHLPIYYNCFGRHICEYEQNIEDFSTDKIYVMHLVGRKISPKYNFDNLVKENKHSTYLKLVTDICADVNDFIDKYQKNNKLLNLKHVLYPFVCDLVVPYVDSSDKNWQELFNEYNPIKDKEVEDINAVNRFRGQGEFFRYFFRCVEKNMPWINKIHLLVQSESQIPNWLDRDKVHVVYHDEFIPKEFLPTFNSTCIEMFIPFIPNLSEHFIYTNDDNYVVSPVSVSNFFDNNKVVKKIRQIRVSNAKNTYEHHIMNSHNIIFNDSSLGYYIHDHSMRPFLKSKCIECFNKYKDEILESCTKFRDEKNFNIYLYDNYLIKNTNYCRTEAMTLNICTKKLSILKQNLDCLSSSIYKFMNICDNASEINIYENKLLVNYFQIRYPKLSKYEVEYINVNIKVSDNDLKDEASYASAKARVEKLLERGWIDKAKAEDILSKYR